MANTPSPYDDAFWVAVATLLLTMVILFYTAYPFHLARRRDRREARAMLPGVKATVNSGLSVDGWRSIQIHIQLPPADPANTNLFGQWIILDAEIKQPKDAEIAFARRDDSSLSGPIVRISKPLMRGRREGQLQRFAMEFFIRFPETPASDPGRTAKFKVRIARLASPDDVYTHLVEAEVPQAAVLKRQAP